MTGTLNPQAMDKIGKLEAPKAKITQDLEVVYDSPIFTEHLNNLTVKEKGTAVFQCKLQPSNDPTMKIGM